MRSELMQLIVALFCAGLPQQASTAILLCGSGRVPYDPTTHHCENGILRKNEMTACGVPPIKINKRTHTCVNGSPVLITEVPKERHPIVAPKFTTPSTSIPRSTESVCRIDQLKAGEACCYTKVYKPAAETCCIITQSYYEVFSGAEDEHVCCPNPETMTSKVYKRGSPDVPCQHASANNKLLKKGVSLKKIGMDSCKSFTYVFRLEVMAQTIHPENSRLDIRLQGWTRTKTGCKRIKLSPLEMGYSDHVHAKLDKYIPDGKKYVQRKSLELEKKSFLILTEKNYAADAVFYLNPDEVLFRLPERISTRKIRKRIQRRCKC